MRWAGLLLLASSSALLGLVAAQEGCSNCTAERTLVCGVDGITYINECLAQCQNVSIASAGHCGSDARAQAAADAVAGGIDADILTMTLQAVARGALPGSPAASSPPDKSSGTTIPRSAMERYKHEGFLLVAKAKEAAFTPRFAAKDNSSLSAAPVDSNVDPLATLLYDPSTSEQQQPQLTPVGATAVRKSVDGFVYMLSGKRASKRLKAALLAAAATIANDADALASAVAQSGGSSSPGQAPTSASPPDVSNPSTSGNVTAALTASLFENLQAGHRRLLHIIGSDDRVELTDYPGWPYTAVGQFLFTKGSCSGIMIGPRSVLTAGHCVYSRKRQAWQDKMTFTPYRHRVGGIDTWPMGRIPYLHATTYQGFMEATDYNNALNYDLAVVQLAEDIGYKTGWLGMTWNPRGYKGVVYTAGYPGDKAFGSLWTTSCRVTDAKGTDTRFMTLCDVFPGQSGSAIWIKPTDTTYELRAVLTYESCRCCSADCSCCNGKFNGGNAINAMHYASIQAWK